MLVETLEQRIAARLNEALDRQVAAEVYSGSERGLVDMNGNEDVPHPRLSIEDVARIAAAEAHAWF